MITLTKEQAKFIIQELEKDLKEKSKKEFNSQNLLKNMPITMKKNISIYCMITKKIMRFRQSIAKSEVF